MGLNDIGYVLILCGIVVCGSGLGMLFAARSRLSDSMLVFAIGLTIITLGGVSNTVFLLVHGPRFLIAPNLAVNIIWLCQTYKAWRDWWRQRRKKRLTKALGRIVVRLRRLVVVPEPVVAT